MSSESQSDAKILGKRSRVRVTTEPRLLSSLSARSSSTDNEDPWTSQVSESATIQLPHLPNSNNDSRRRRNHLGQPGPVQIPLNPRIHSPMDCATDSGSSGELPDTIPFSSQAPFTFSFEPPRELTQIPVTTNPYSTDEMIMSELPMDKHSINRHLKRPLHASTQFNTDSRSQHQKRHVRDRKHYSQDYEDHLYGELHVGKTMNSEEIDEKIGHLKSEIAALELLKRQQIPHTWKTIHRVWSSETEDGFQRQKWSTSYFLDPPRWFGGIEDQLPLAGTEPITQLSSYLERHSELAFVVLRDYNTPHSDGEHFSKVDETTSRSKENEFPSPNGETIRFISQDLAEAYTNFVHSIPAYNEIAYPVGEESFDDIAAPYLDIFFNQDRFEDFATMLPTRHQGPWELFRKYVERSFFAEYAEARRLFQQGLIVPRMLKYLFRPGDVLHCPTNSVLEAVQMVSGLGAGVLRNKLDDLTLYPMYQGDDVLKGQKKSKPMHLNWSFKVKYYSFRVTFREEIKSIRLSMPQGIEAVPIISLEFYPIEYSPPGVKELLQRRGESFWLCRHRRFVEYSKDGAVHAWSGIKSRYMIDAKTYLRMHGAKDVDGDESSQGDLPLAIMTQDQCPSYPFPFLTPRSVKGYNFTEKEWNELQIDHISDVQWNTKAFENLVTDEETKDLLEALVTNHLVGESSTDLIAGKGNGLIILLHGGPGTGKTYTAESVADYAKKPLYRVTCGDIGTKPVEVEKYLETVLRLGRIWNCVVLLDEADVFLEQRTLADLERNALVSVFLRILEYYTGILILTSNRVGHFDEAFRSRIQLALHYKSLDQDQRKQIWTNFLKNLRASGTSAMDFDDLVMHVHDLSQFEMNGRQIRNTITTARQLADFRKRALDYSILKKVIRVAGKFDTYLQDVKRIEHVKNGTVDDEIAREAGDR